MTFALQDTLSIIQRAWRLEGGGVPSRAQLMQLLHSIDSIKIKASYKTNLVKATITDVRLDTAEKNGAGDLAVSVEQCRCPAPYTGAYFRRYAYHLTFAINRLLVRTVCARLLSPGADATIATWRLRRLRL